ncbi:ATPases involved in chromosome partitioning-like protein [Oceaniovalibus guishaninsula JLT2003]|uniref:ATPases involved in chromosome partitioning-like protein n=1 Tax=Oceaniovalibus guishaninsula JLT2003 TaxID=1231392 RepID=K2GKK9_9RHOB|nr:CpsD/CapB family tyrosine-protein kinase [Oceaniovalibus guishaninsula]EKE43306.1 ATPases involved in chromosome partitioning-like protein [Oceaniovalibus guishaninsula JLT2003]
MEKLQSAIAKARARRGDAPPVPGGAPAPRPDRPAKGTDADAAWADLPLAEPETARLLAQRIVAGTRDRAASEFDKLRTRMLQRMQSQNWRRVAITSPGAASGKSTIALNLGFSLARQQTIRTIICEMDLRRPSLARMLGTPPELDFARVLSGNAPFADHAVRLRDNLAVGVARGHVERSAELLQAARTGQVLDAIQERYAPTLMLFDMPPFQVSDDTLAFADKVDCVLIVAAAGSTSVAQIDACERDLSERTEILGVVLNKCRHMPADEGYDYYG